MTNERAPCAEATTQEMLPELDPRIRHMGAKALSLVMSSATTAAATIAATTLPVDDLPTFEVYIVAKFPGLEPAAVDALVQRFKALDDQHSHQHAATRDVEGSSPQ
jgi:hypothetical protein